MVFDPNHFHGQKKDENGSVENPKHYVSHPSGVECIEVAEHFNFNLGNAIKYIWRSDLKNNKVEDLQKALWYIKREIDRIELGRLKDEGFDQLP